MPVTKNHALSSSRLKALSAKLPATLIAVFAVMLVSTAAAQAKLGAPKLQSPGNSSTAASMPAFTWKAVAKAASYQFEFSAERNFSSSVPGWSAGPITLDTTAITNDDTVPNGTYFWRVRAMSATDVPGRWSAMRKLKEKWVATAALTSPVNNTTVNWPSTPLTLTWKTAPGAVNYDIEISTTPTMSNLVYGPTQVQGPEYVIPNELAPNSTYYWTVQPVNGAGQLGTKSKVGTFTLDWPSNTTLTETDTSPDSTYEEPTFSWTAVPGAASYELEVSSDPSYPANAIIIDSTGLITDNYHPTSFLPNHTTLYWRIRARDDDGNAGSWNDGQSFTETFDTGIPSITNLEVIDGTTGAVLNGGNTSDPIVKWTPVPGASSYTVTMAAWNAGSGCDYNNDVKTTSTPETALTPIGQGENNNWQNTQYGWTGAANNGTGIIINGALSVCVSVIAERNDSPLAGSTIESTPTVLGSTTTPAFSYVPPTSSGTLAPGIPVSTYSPGLASPAYGTGTYTEGSTLSTTPLFQWQSVPGAAGYYLIIANDQNFDPNSIVTGVYTAQTSYVPPLSLKDQSGDYWWEVIPVASPGSQPLSDPETGDYDPQYFNKSSTPPTPVSPVNGVNVGTQPVFSWTSAQAAENYTFEVSADPSFANPIETDTTDSTSLTSSTTLPPGETLYWRVRANDIDNGLNWSAVQTFTHNLPAPTPLASNPVSGSTIPLLAWSPVTLATGYNLQITSGTNVATFAVDTPYLTPTELLAPGISTYKIQSVFPGGATSAYSSAVTYKRSLPAPSIIHATKSGSRVLVTWKSDPIAKAYTIELSTTPGFSSPIASDNTQNLAWVPQIPAADVNKKLYWRIAAVDFSSNVGAFHQGVFKGKVVKKAKSTKKTKKKSTKKK
jgi:hypothetical protein